MALALSLEISRKNKTLPILHLLSASAVVLVQTPIRTCLDGHQPLVSTKSVRMDLKMKALDISNVVTILKVLRIGTGKRTEFKANNFPGPADKGINLKTSVS